MNTNNPPLTGLYGSVADAGADLMRHKGLGPLSKWVDDHIFIRLLRQHVDAYNATRSEWAKRIAARGGRHHTGGRFWYGGHALPDNRLEEFDEDMLAPIRNFPLHARASAADAPFAYSIHDIDYITNELGVPWENSKDVPFSEKVPFAGLLWDLALKRVSLGKSKPEKYLKAIAEFRAKPTHDLQEVRKLYGKLLHACLAIPRGRAYLTRLEAMLGVFHNSPFKPRTPPSGTDQDLAWWTQTLSRPILARSIPAICTLHDVGAFSDASSSVGIGLIIGDRWRAWRLAPGWNDERRDIGWAEAIGFEFLVRTILVSGTRDTNFKVYGDNNGIVKGWWKGSSRNQPSNEAFKRIHELCEDSGCSFHTRYVTSGSNPADGPSRGIYPPTRLLLPPIEIPAELRPFILNFDHPPLASEIRIHETRLSQRALPKIRCPQQTGQAAEVNRALEREAEDLFCTSAPWRDL